MFSHTVQGVKSEMSINELAAEVAPLVNVLIYFELLMIFTPEDLVSRSS